MRLGGGQNGHTRRQSLRYVAPALVCMAVLLAGGTPARADDSATARLWVVTRAGNGQIHVVRGLRAAIARMDVQLGRQVRHAVEILVQALDRADRESGGVLLGDTPG